MRHKYLPTKELNKQMEKVVRYNFEKASKSAVYWEKIKKNQKQNLKRMSPEVKRAVQSRLV